MHMRCEKMLNIQLEAVYFTPDIAMLSMLKLSGNSMFENVSVYLQM